MDLKLIIGVFVVRQVCVFLFYGPGAVLLSHPALAKGQLRSSAKVLQVEELGFRTLTSQIPRSLNLKWCPHAHIVDGDT